jgi:hypothetical protein
MQNQTIIYLLLAALALIEGHYIQALLYALLAANHKL